MSCPIHPPSHQQNLVLVGKLSDVKQLESGKPVRRKGRQFRDRFILLKKIHRQSFQFQDDTVFKSE